MEDAGIDPATSRMLSARSTIWANPRRLVFLVGIQYFINPLILDELLE